MFKVIVFVAFLVSLVGTNAQFTAYSSLPWGSRPYPLPTGQYYSSGRQQYQNTMAPSNADPIDKLMNYLNYATPSSNYQQNYKLSLDSGLRYRPSENHDTRFKPTPQDKYRHSTIVYDTVTNDNKGVFETIAGAVGIKVPVEINVRDVINAILKFGQSIGVVKVNPNNSNMFTLLENPNSNQFQNDYNIPNPSSDGSTPSNVIQFNIIKLDGSRVAESRPDNEARPSPGPGFEPRPEYPQSDCASHSHPGQMGPHSRSIDEPLPYWIHRPY